MVETELTRNLVQHRIDILNSALQAVLHILARSIVQVLEGRLAMHDCVDASQ